MNIYIELRIAHIFVFGALITLSCAKLHAQLEPVDGQLAEWNEDWRRLQLTKQRPLGTVLVAFYLCKSFEGASIVTLVRQSENKVVLYFGKSLPTSFELGKKIVPSVTASAIAFDESLAKRINSLWLDALLATRYTNQSGQSQIYDGALGVAGATNELKPYRFLMGEIPGSTNRPPVSLRWMVDAADCLARIAENPPQSENALEGYKRLGKVLTDQEAIHKQKAEAK